MASNFRGRKIKLGKRWEPVQFAVSGFNPIVRCMAVAVEVTKVQQQKPSTELFNSGLTVEELSLVSKLIDDFPTLFAENPKRSSKATQGTLHSIELENFQPLRARPRKITPSWEEEVSRTS